MQAIAGPLGLILDVVFFIMIVHIIMSWLINFQVLNLRQPIVGPWDGLNRLLEPIYQPSGTSCPIPAGWTCAAGGFHHPDRAARLHPARTALRRAAAWLLRIARFEGLIT